MKQMSVLMVAIALVLGGLSLASNAAFVVGDIINQGEEIKAVGDMDFEKLADLEEEFNNGKWPKVDQLSQLLFHVSIPILVFGLLVAATQTQTSRTLRRRAAFCGKTLFGAGAVLIVMTATLMALVWFSQPKKIWSLHDKDEMSEYYSWRNSLSYSDIGLMVGYEIMIGGALVTLLSRKEGTIP